MTPNPPTVGVIIAAWNAERTIGCAIRSALAQPEVSEVMVVDDASGDHTVATALAACDGTGRLKVIRQPENRGPAAARNRAIAESAAPIIAILDSDDFFVPGRFTQLLAVPEWDAIFDDIAFITEADTPHFSLEALRQLGSPPERLAFSAFIRGNISVRGKPRAELGFIKPLIRRAFLDEHGLRYYEALRLGEDYVLYAQMLALGARFIKVRSCGYVAVERAQSLSGRHQTSDLKALLGADRDLLHLPVLADDERLMLRAHASQLAGKARYREILDVRRAHGRLRAIGSALMQPKYLPALIRSVWYDKIHSPQSERPSSTIRYLFP